MKKSIFSFVVSFTILLSVAACDMSFMIQGKTAKSTSLTSVAETIAECELYFLVPPPVTGRTPQTEFSSPEYSGSVVWSQNGLFFTGPFASGKEYSAVVTLAPNNGFYFSGSETFTHQAASNVVQNYNSGSFVVTLYFPATLLNTSYTDLSFLAPPATGGTPQTEIASPEYSGSVVWKQNGVLFADAFTSGKEYSAVVTLTANNGYFFSGSETFTHQAAVNLTQTYSSDSFIVALFFPATRLNTSYTDLSFLAPPVTGGTPQTEFSSPEYSCSIVWKQNGVLFSGAFTSGKEYSAVVTLTAHNSYFFSGSETFTHQAAVNLTQAYDSGSFVVTLFFPATSDLRAVTNTNLFFLSAPVTGNAPQTEIASPEYSCSVVWKQNGVLFSDAFTSGKEYSAAVTLTANNGYFFSGSETFTHQAAVNLTQAYNSGSFVVTLYFPATLLNTAYTDLSFLPIPVTGGTPQTEFSSPEYSGSVVWKQNGVLFTGAFASGKEYAAAVTLIPNNGFFFSGSETFTHQAAVNLTQAYNSGSFVVTLYFPATSDLRAVTNTNLFILPSPATGGTPQKVVSMPEYSGSVVWKQNGVPITGAFAGGKEYSAVVTLAPNNGFYFSGSETFSHQAAVNSIQDFYSGSFVVTFFFPATTHLITMVNLSSIPVPVTAGTPQLELSTAEYGAQISWNQDGLSHTGNFQGGKYYSALVTITPKAGYGFDGFSGTFSHPGGATGISQTIINGKALVTIAFPQTRLTISFTDLSLLTAPAAGGTPLTSLNAAEYTASAAWRYNGAAFSGNFVAGRQYTAIVTVTPKNGYGFDAFSGTFSHRNASSVSQTVSNSTATVTITFPSIYLPASDANFSSFTGTRQETYHIRPEPALDDIPITLTLRGEKLFPAYNSYYGNLTLHNSVTFTVPFKALFIPGDYSAEFTGTLPLTAQYMWPSGDATFSSTVSFNNTKTLFLDLSGLNPVVEEFNMPKTFNNTSYVLPLNGYPVDPYILEFRTKTYKASLTSEQFEQISKPHNTLTGTPEPTIIWDTLEYHYFSAYTDDPGIRTDPFRPVSRNFYRYQSFSLSFPAPAKIFGVTPASIVSSFAIDDTERTLTVTLNYYNYAFSGEVISFWILAEDGNVRQKKITIQ
jgi:hypothetical protein